MPARLLLARLVPARIIPGRLAKLLRFRRNVSGNVAITFAFLLLPMLGAIGLAVDFGSILTVRNLAQVGADAAALQASGVARDLIQKGGGSQAESIAAVAEAKRRATSMFNAYAAQNGLGDYTIAVDVVRDGQKIVSTASFSVGTDTHVAKLYGEARYEATGLAVSGSSLPSYVDVYVAMDHSQSMGIAATQDEMKKLQKLVGCVFGCHVPEHNQSVSNETTAKNNGIRMRIDVLRDAFKKMVTTAKTDAGDAASYRFAMYMMGADPLKVASPRTLELSPISSNFADLLKKADDIQLGYNTVAGVGDTHLNEQITVLRNKIPASGDGSSQGTSNKYLFIITDGARDVSGNCEYGHCMATIDPAVCRQVKDKNIIVGVLYTTFLPIYTDPFNPAKGFDFRYKDLIVKTGLVPTIGPKLEACASPGWFFEASDAASIDTALAKMFEQTANAPALMR